jgi:hypothetical protein
LKPTPGSIIRSGRAKPSTSRSGSALPLRNVSKKPPGPNMSSCAVNPCRASSAHSRPTRAACPEWLDLVMLPVLSERLPAREPAMPSAMAACRASSPSALIAAAVAPNVPVVPGL